MSALDKFLESRKVDTRATGEIQDGYKVYETVHDGLYESALVEVDTLRAQLAEAREIISEAKIEIGFSIYGKTQPSTSTYDKLTAYLKKVTTA